MVGRKSAALGKHNSDALSKLAEQPARDNFAPDNPGIHYHLGLAYQKTDQPGLARQQLERVLKIDPNYSGAADVKKQLAQLKS